MRAVDDSFWTVPVINKLGGWLALNTRMSVVRLSENRLVLHSPVAFTPELRASIDACGTVHAIVAPNLLHHLYVGDWLKHYPEALSFGAEGLEGKRPDLDFTASLGEVFDQRFGDELQRIPILGMPKVNESLFFHRASGALLVTDFSFFMPEAAGMTSLYASLMGFKKRVVSPLLFRLAVKDKNAFRNSLAPLRSLGVRHLSMCHHSVLSEGATEALGHVLDQLNVPVPGGEQHDERR